MTTLALVLSIALGQAAAVRQTAYARVESLRAAAADPDVVEFVRAKNASGETLEEIHEHDLRWGSPDYAKRMETVSGDCAERLRALVAEDAVVVEALLMDRQGALVCASAGTSDYWQGDEAKWSEVFAEQRDIFVDEPAHDASTGAFAIQLAAPVFHEGARIGALALTLKLAER